MWLSESVALPGRFCFNKIRVSKMAHMQWIDICKNKRQNYVNETKIIRWPLGEVIKDIDIGARDLGFDSQAGQIRYSVANGSARMRCFFGAVLLRR